MKFLLDYFFPITAINPTPPASTAFLKQALVIVAPKVGVTPGEITMATTNAQIAALTDNTEAQQLLNAGMSRVFILPMNDLNLATALEGHETDFFTILISSDFDAADIEPDQASGNITITNFANLISGTADVVAVAGVNFTAQAAAVTPGGVTFQAATSNDATAASLAAQINEHATAKLAVTAVAVGPVVTITAKNSGSGGNTIALGYTDNDANVGATKSGTTLTGGDGLFAGAFTGVIGVSSDDDAFLADQAAIENRAAFHAADATGAKNMFYAFGKLLSNPVDWLNQQYITMPFADDVENLGQANTLFDDKINMVITDDEFGNRLGLFAAGGKAIAAPYIIKNLQIDMQSRALQYISGNQPSYTRVQGALLEDELQKVIDLYITRAWIESGSVAIALDQGNFVASGAISVSEPKALWRIFANITQTT